MRQEQNQYVDIKQSNTCVLGLFLKVDAFVYETHASADCLHSYMLLHCCVAKETP